VLPVPLCRPPLEQLSPPAKQASELLETEKHSGREERVRQAAGEESITREKEVKEKEDQEEKEEEEEKKEEMKEDEGHTAAIDKLEADKHHFGSPFSSPKYC
jgi:hypothetical protein